MLLLLWFLLLLLLPVGATLLFTSLGGHRIGNDVLRIVAVGLFYVVALLGYLYGTVGLAISIAFDLNDMYPVVEQPLNDTYYFTRQEYGFATIMSHGYNLKFYRTRSFWPDQEVGQVQLECVEKEAVDATLTPVSGSSQRLRLQANGVTRLDTVLDLAKSFNFRRTFEARTIDFARKPR